MRPAVPAILAVTLALAVVARADTGGWKPDRPAGATGDLPGSEPASPRQQAEQLYGDAVDDATQAKRDLADDKRNNAEKRLRRALDRLTRATELDSTFHEAWSLEGYSLRKLGDYPHALEAYGRSLRLKPDYAPAREYLGEAYVDLGRMDDARAQLDWLVRLKADDLAGELRAAIAARAGAVVDSAKRAVEDSLKTAPAPQSR